LGAHDWTDAGLGRARSFVRSARRIVAHLYDSAGFGLDPELVLDLFDDPAGAGDQLARVRDTLDYHLRERREEGRPVTDLLVYYIGHGQVDDQGHLSLLVRRSRRGLEAETGIKAPDLARTLRLSAPQQRRSIILDCCFSEAAARDFIGMAGDLNQQVAATAAKDLGDDQPARGTLLLCSSPVGEVSIGAPNAERTLFTGTVLEVLQQGVEGRPQYLSFADVRDAVFERMVVSFGARAPRPALHQVNAAQGDLTRMPAFPNRANARAKVLSPERASLSENRPQSERSQAIDTPPSLTGVDSPSVMPIESRNNNLLGVEGNTERQAWALLSNGFVLGTLGRSQEEIAVYDDLIARFGTATEPALREPVARALVSKGARLYALGRREEEIAVYDDLIARFGIATEPALREPVAKALVSKGYALYALGRREEEIAVYDDLIARFGTATEPALREPVARALVSKGDALYALDRSKERIAVYDDLIARFGTATEPALREPVAYAKSFRDHLRKS
jgi:tetratricopeptide (TPR) repeat protein